ncbi:MAG: TIGR00730 family Rossman fold protein [Verrucomicrobium sp.]|nr:TIGR00730 family Rossman fold protein [Verrucomicrobium sp.]
MPSAIESKAVPAAPYTTDNPVLDQKIRDLLKEAGIDPSSREYYEMMVSVLKLAGQKPTRADRKLYNQALKELRYANKIFTPYRDRKKICIFGSARTPAKNREYQAARDFAELMVKAGYMVITGGGDGIMGAAQEGAGRENSFGLNINLPFEQRANPTIDGDSKLIHFRYFFTRKLNFVKESHAIVCFPGGFGTMDEGFEAITLMQTGKTPVQPVLFIDAPGGNFWLTFERYLREHLLRDGLISDYDFHLFKFTDDLRLAEKEILAFYYNFHSYRFVDKELVIRLQRPIPDGALERLRHDFADILADPAAMRLSKPLPQEANEPDLAHLHRLRLPFNQKGYGRLRQLIDRLNEF